MTIAEISTIIVYEQDAEIKALKRVKFLREKAKAILCSVSSPSLLTDAQIRNMTLFEEIAEEIEVLNIAHKAMYRVLDVKFHQESTK